MGGVSCARVFFAWLVFFMLVGLLCVCDCAEVGQNARHFESFIVSN